MYMIDYHLHTKYSSDSREEFVNVCNKAIEMGVQEIAFTDHLDIVSNGLSDDNVVKQRFAEINTLKSAYADKIIIRNGVELGEPQVNTSEADKFCEAAHLDFIIGSIHNLKNDFVDFGLDSYDYINNDCYRIYENYLDNLIDLSLNYDFDVLGHITLPLRYMPVEISSALDITSFEEKYRQLFAVLLERNKGIELNTSGLRMRNGETYPCPTVLKWYKDSGGEIITVGSDAHSEKDVAFGVKAGYEMLKSLGFKYIATYHNRDIIYKNL